jgi:hypothetical protein
MKNILLVLMCFSLFSCGSSDGGSDEDVQPDYTAVKQQLPLKLENWEKYVNAKDFTAAKSISIANGGFWNAADEAEDVISSNKQMSYDFKNYQLDAGTFLPDQGTVSVKGKVLITQGALKTVEEKDFTATMYCPKDPLSVANWSLDDLILF